MVLCKCSLKILLTSLYLVEGLAWWFWPFTWCTDQLLSFSARHCWLGYLTRKNRPRYHLFGGMLNPTLLYSPHCETRRCCHTGPSWAWVGGGANLSICQARLNLSTGLLQCDCLHTLMCVLWLLCLMYNMQLVLYFTGKPRVCSGSRHAVAFR